MDPNYWRLPRNFTNHYDSVEEKQNKRLTGAVVAVLRDSDERDPGGWGGWELESPAIEEAREGPMCLLQAKKTLEE